MTSPTIPSAPRMSVPRQIGLNTFWFSNNVMWTAILLIIMPAYIQSIVPDSQKGVLLGIVLGTGAAVSMICAPIIGALSDRVRIPGGRRRPWLVIGTAGSVAALLWLSVSTRLGDPSSLPGWISAFILLEICSNIAAAPCSALIADQVPARQRGSAAGWLGSMTMLGGIVGGCAGLLILPLGVHAIYRLVIAIMLPGMLLTVLAVGGAAIAPATPPFSPGEFFNGLFSPFRHVEFNRVFFNRLFAAMGTFTIQQFIIYYMADAFGMQYILPFVGRVARNPDEATSIFLAGVFVAALAIALIAGLLSDKYGRKPITYSAAIALAVSSMCFTFSHSFAQSVIVGIVFGLGYGAYETVNWALVTDVLPSPHDHAKDMGIWHVTFVLPQLIATPIAGFIMDRFQTTGAGPSVPQTGYIIMFVIAAVYFILSSIFLRMIQAVR